LTLAIINILRLHKFVYNTSRLMWRFTDGLRFGVTVYSAAINGSRRLVLVLSMYSTVEICWQHMTVTSHSVSCPSCPNLKGVIWLKRRPFRW